MTGTLERLDDDRVRLTFTRVLDHPREKVWRAVTENAHLEAWFPDGGITGDRVVGATLGFGTGADGSPMFDGEMLAFVPPGLMEFRWGTDTIRIELADAPDGTGTVLTLVDTFTEVGKAARDAAGWHDCIDQLAHHLDGTVATLAAGARWPALHAAYVERLGPEASTIGVPEDHEFADE